MSSRPDILTLAAHGRMLRAQSFRRALQRLVRRVKPPQP